MPVLDVVKLQGLIAEYGQLRRLVGYTRQTRGQRFNEVIAEMLRCWGIEARASIRSHGEIDVVFSVDGVRYVVEAKWEQAKTHTGHVAKLQKRVRQRLAGTYGIFLAMSGYTAEALVDVAHGERLEVLLLDASHFEAMLAGLVPPEEMLTLVHDRAAFHAEPYTPLAALLASTVQPSVAFGPPASMPNGLVRTAMPGVAGEVLFSVADSNQIGLVAMDHDHLLVTTQHGIMAVDLAKRTAGWAVPVPGGHRNPLVHADGAILFTRRHGVGRYHNGELTVLGGGLAGNTRLMRHPNGDAWVFSHGKPDGPVGASITRLGNRLGDEERFPHDYPAGSAMSCSWLNEHEVVAVGSTALSVSAVPHGPSRWLRVPQTNPIGLARLTPSAVLTAGDAPGLLYTDLVTGRTAEVAQLNLPISISELTVGVDGSVCIAAYTQSTDGRMPFLVARLRIPLEIHPPTPVATTAVLAATAPAAREQRPYVDATLPPQAPAAVQDGPATVPQQRPTTVHDQVGPGWRVSRPDRGNPAGKYITFGAWSGVYWSIVGINTLLIAVLAIVLLVPEPSAVVKIIVGVIELFLVTVTIGFGKMAADPIRLEIGTQGIQVFARSGTSWFPWRVIDRVEVMRLEGGNLHIVAWCTGANMFPEFDGFSGGPRFLPRLGAVAVCPINVIRTRRHVIVRALYTYGGNRVGTL